MKEKQIFFLLLNLNYGYNSVFFGLMKLNSN